MLLLQCYYCCNACAVLVLVLVLVHVLVPVLVPLLVPVLDPGEAPSSVSRCSQPRYKLFIGPLEWTLDCFRCLQFRACKSRYTFPAASAG